ncbi:MAG: NAD(P)H-dependent oxidoreductase, partial [Wenzhouxiangellaceae bacterium]|nr:NAD(P)H-dependent oxidoreductase [Wenzhouxiangellaceae bacterium]
AAVRVRNLWPDTIPHLDDATFEAFATPGAERSDDQKRLVALSDALIAELEAADVVVIGLPMYNFGVPSTLKAWFDHVARAGVTFRYTETGPEGLVRGKRAVIACARGGRYSGTADDLQTAYVRKFLGFIGITDIEMVYAEGLAAGNAREQALAGAGAELDRLAAALRAEAASEATA